MTDRLVAQIADGAAVEARQPGHGDRAELPELRLDHAQRVAVLVLQRAHPVGLGPDERVAAHPFAALDGLEQEGEGAAGDLEVRRDRCLEVGADLAIHRREVPLARGREAVQLLAARGRRARQRGGHRRNPVRAAPRLQPLTCHQRAARSSIRRRGDAWLRRCTIGLPHPSENKRTTAPGAMVLAVPPSFAPGDLLAVRAYARHSRDAASLRGAGGAALGLDNGAPTVDAYWSAIRGWSDLRAETPGSIRPLLVGRRASTVPRLSGPRVAAYYSRSASFCHAAVSIEATTEPSRVSTNGAAATPRSRGDRGARARLRSTRGSARPRPRARPRHSPRRGRTQRPARAPRAPSRDGGRAQPRPLRAR